MLLIASAVSSKPYLVLVSALALSACGAGADAARIVTDEEVARRAANLQQPMAGLYRSVTRMSEYRVADTSPQAAELLRVQMLGLNPQELNFCLTEEQAKTGFTDLLHTVGEGQCRFTEFAAGSVHLRAQLHCDTADGGVSEILLQGTSRKESSRVELEVTHTGPSVPGGSLALAMTIENRRTGSCRNANLASQKLD